MLTSKNDPLSNDKIVSILDEKDGGDLIVDLITTAGQISDSHRQQKEIKATLADALKTGSHPPLSDLLMMVQLEQHLTMLLDALSILYVRLKEVRDSGQLHTDAVAASRSMVQEADSAAGSAEPSGGN